MHIKKLATTGVCMALCVVLPMAFHSIPNGGSIFSPMHIPVLLCGLLCGWYYGLLCGLAGPLLSSLITGMPPIGYLPPMLVELAVYGLVAGLMMLLVRTKRNLVNVYVSLISAMLVGRVVAGIAKALFFTQGGYSVGIWVTAYFVTSWPGIVAHLVLIPVLVLTLKKAGLVK